MSRLQTSQLQTSRLQTRVLGATPDALAPDGSEVRLLAALEGASFAHFTLAPGRVSQAVAHRTVEEIWYFVSGEGEVWRRIGDEESVVVVREGFALTIPLGAWFQFRAGAAGPLSFVAATLPPWPGPEEAFAVEGKWPASV